MYNMIKWLLNSKTLKYAVRTELQALQHKLTTGERLTSAEHEYIQQTYYDYKYYLAKAK